MSGPSRFSTRKPALCVSWVLLQATCGLSAQNFTLSSGNLDPFGVNGPLPFGEALDLVGLTGLGLKGGFAYGLAAESTYDSNFFQTSDDRQDELIAALTPSISYISDPEGGANVRIAADYQPTANFYLENSEFNDVDQSASVSLFISGARTSISAYGGYIQESETDRFAGGFVTGSTFSSGLRASYQIAPRTLVFAGLTHSSSSYDGNEAEGFDKNSASVGAFWSATERFRLGPSLRYSMSESDNSGTRDSWDFSIVSTYKAQERIQLAASLGIEYVEDSRQLDSGEWNFLGSLSASYRINELWSWRLSIQSGFVPSPTQTNAVINNWTITSLLNRDLNIGTLAVGVDLEIAESERVGVSSGTSGSEEFGGVFLAYARPVLNDRADFRSRLRYSVNNGEEEWTQIEFTVGLGLSF